MRPVATSPLWQNAIFVDFFITEAGLTQTGCLSQWCTIITVEPDASGFY